MAVKVTNTGLAMMTARILGVTTGNGSTAPSFLKMGTGTTAPTNGDTQLSAPVSVGAGVISRITAAVTLDTYQVTGELEAVSASAITEVGLFDGTAANANMFLRSTFAAINLGQYDSIQFSIHVIFQDSN